MSRRPDKLPLSVPRFTGRLQGRRNRIMKRHPVVALSVALAMVAATAQMSLIAAGQGRTTISGTAKDEAKKPFPQSSVRARDTSQGQIAGTAPLSAEGNFTL